MIRTPRDRFRTGLRELGRSERGIALPVALLITVIALGFAAVPIVASVSSQEGDSHNQGGNEALAAAEAGAELAVLRQGKMRSSEPESPCGTGQSPSAGWCPGVTGSVAGASYAYRVQPCYASNASSASCTEVTASTACTDSVPIRVVSTGGAPVGGNEVTRRIELNACASALNAAAQQELETLEAELKQKEEAREKLAAQVKKEQEKWVASGSGATWVEIPKEVPPPNVFAKGQIVGVEWLKMNNNAQVYNGGAGSNGSVSLVGSANVCGTVQYGTSSTFTTDSSSSNKAPSNCAAGRTVSKGTSEYPPVSLPSDIETNNSNWRLAGEDKVPSSVWQRGNISWSSTNKALSVNYSSLALGGSAPYYLCQLTLAGGSTLEAAPGAKIKIFFVEPTAKKCPGLNGAPQLTIANGTHVAADSGSGPGFYFVGSTTANASRIELQGGATGQQFVIYAPYSTVNAANGVNLTGVIIGRTLELGGGASINAKGPFSPPSTSEFLAPTISKEKVPGTPTQNTVLEEHEKQLKELTEEVLAKFEQVTTLKQSSSGGGSSGSASLERTSFIECSAAPPGATEAPDAGC